MKINKWTENIVVFFTLLFIFYFVAHNAINAPFTVEDEYNNFKWSNANQAYPIYQNFFQTIFTAISNFLAQGRLLVTHLVIIITRAKLFGINPFPHHLVVFLFGVTTAFFIYKSLVKASFSKLNSFIGALIYLSGHAFSEIFFRLSSGECTGNLFLLIAIYFIISFSKNNSKLNFYLGVIFGMLAAYAKESYIILFPLLFTIPFILIETEKWKAYAIQNLHKYYLVVFCFGVLILSLFLTIHYSGIVFSYGQPLSKTETALNNFIWLTKWFVLFIPLVILALIHFIKIKSVNSLWPLILFSLAWLGSQILIYYKVIISFSQGRYMMPAGLILILLIVISLQYIKENISKIYIFVIILVSLFILRNFKIVYINANEFYARASAFNALIHKLVDEKPNKIAIYGGVEFFQSINEHFKYNHYYPKFITTPVVFKEDHFSAYYDESYSNELQKMLNSIYEFKTLEDLKSDSSVNTMIAAEPEETYPVNYKVVMQTFKKIDRISMKFSNPGLKDLLNPTFWKGQLLNDQRTYLIFRK